MMQYLDTVALTSDLPQEGLVRGQVGTIVEVLEPGVFEVEFADLEGRAYAFAAVPESSLLMLKHQTAEKAA